MKFKVIIQFIILLTVFKMYSSLSAYDCGDIDAEISSISLLDVKSCSDPLNSTMELNQHIQLIQERKFAEVHVFACQVTVQQQIFYCGWLSHMSNVRGGLVHYVHLVEANACRETHQTKSLNLKDLGAGRLDNLKLNGTTEVSATLVGALDNDGSCKGETYSYQGTTYTQVVVTASISIKLTDYTATVSTEDDLIHLRSGITCFYSEKSCFDDSIGKVTWENDYRDRCTETGVDVLYEGDATLLTLTQSNSKYIVVKTNDTAFALNLKRSEYICSQPAWRTEQNRMLVIFKSPVMGLGFHYKKSKRIATNTDPMAQVLSKLLYLEIAFKNETQSILYQSIKKRCQIRENVLRNRLALAYSTPDVVSSIVKGAAGHMGRVMGEVLYIVRCVEKKVELRMTKACYQELPITVAGKKKFMMPITHIIQAHGSQITCNNKMPPMVRLNGKWKSMNSDILNYPLEPITLDANDVNDKIIMTKISAISENGVYTKEDMEAFQNALLFPNEQQAITNIVTRRVVGAETDDQGFHLPNIFSKNEFTSFASNVAKQAWGFLSGLGNLFSSLVVSYLGFGVLKYFISVVINYCVLKKTTVNQRPSPTIIGASLLDSLTQSVLFRQTQKTPKKQTSVDSTDASIEQNLPLIPTTTTV